MPTNKMARTFFDGIQKYCAKKMPCKNGKCVFYDNFNDKCLINYPFRGEQMKMPKIDENLRRLGESE